MLRAAEIVRTDVPGTDAELASVVVSPLTCLVVSATVPVNPLRPVNVRVEVQEVPATMVTSKGLGKISKSGPLTVMNTAALFVIEPLVPEIPTKYDPGLVVEGAATVRMDVRAGGSETLGALSPTVRPGGNDEEGVNVIVPVKPPIGLTVIVELLVAPPGRSVRKSGDEDTAKVEPVTVTKMSTEWKSVVPLEASTPTV